MALEFAGFEVLYEGSGMGLHECTGVEILYEGEGTGLHQLIGIEVEFDVWPYNTSGTPYTPSTAGSTGGSSSGLAYYPPSPHWQDD